MNNAKLSIADDIAEDIATMYRNGELLRVIQAKYPKVNLLNLYGALERHSVPKRGPGSGLRRMWDRAQETGITPKGQPYDPDKVRPPKPAGGWPSKAKRAKAKAAKIAAQTKQIEPRLAPRPPVTTMIKSEGPGVVLLQTLLERHLISQDDINTLALGGAIVSTATPDTATKSKQRSTWVRALEAPEPVHNKKYLEIIKLYKQGRLRHDEIAKIVGIGKSTVTRFAAIYRKYHPSK